ncbi:hypothetical protein KC19_1G294200 [Ceratodon purpureus]|uniref:Protein DETOXIFICATION n=1 Tax=Ceratodon purpureus TaxID=3225 RepID=A0A8T0JDK8_CERPU|nr:hypothetical protein KC19_1G294200 [Ceratodon purpureus]
MTIGEGFTEPLINAEVNPLSMTPSVFTVAENNVAVTRPLSDGHAENPVSHDPEEKGISRWVWAEVREQCWLAGPIMCMYMMQYITNIACTVFMGHLGAFYLAAHTLANCFCSMSGFTVLVGMSTAMETLCGQAYGAKQYHLLGVFLQRAIIILTSTGLPIFGLIWINLERISVALGQDPVIAQAAQTYAYWLFPALFLYALYFPLIKFFQTQRAVLELMLCGVVTVLFHVPLLWLIVDKLNVGFIGVAIAFNIALFINISAFSTFIRFSPRFEKTFPSFTRDAFGDFGDFFRLAIPSATMLCLDHWAYEAMMLLAGLLPNPKLNLSSVAICMGLLSLSNMNALALGVATSVRVANELGAGKAHAARSVVAVSLFIATVYGIVMASLIFSLRDVWGWAFSNDSEVVQHVAHTAPYLAVIAALYALGAALTGVLRGIGWQRAGAVANLGAYYIVGLPVAFVSLFVFHTDSRGIWLGMGCGLVTQIITLLSIILCPNWDQLAQEAMLRSYSFSSKLSTPSLPLTKVCITRPHY